MVYGRTVSVPSSTGNTITYAYDAAGNKTELHSAALDQVFRYDELNRLKEVDSRTLGGAVRTNAFDYDEVGNRKLRVAADSTTTTYGYDERNRLRTLATRSASGLMLLAAVYTVDDSGLRIGIAESNAAGPTRSVGYAYDAVKRLTAEVIQRPGQSSHSVSYEYDAVGNRLRRVTNGVVTTYTVDANDRLIHETEAGVTTLRTYDANGNTTHQSKPGELIEYGYDEANRLVRTTIDNVTSLNGYDADGIRNLEVRDGVITTWVIDPNRGYAQTLEAYRGEQLATVWQFGDDLMAQANVVGGSVVDRSLLADGLGSVRQATNAAGSVTDTFEYDAFGEELARSGTADIDHRYRGEQVDPNTGFYNLRARWMDSDAGRFITSDEWQGCIGDPITLHKSLYANSDPINNIDPSGFATLSELNVTTAIKGIGRSNNATKAQKGYNKVRQGLCKASKAAATQAHHVWPMFLGGPSTGITVDLPKNFHTQFHQLLHYMLRMFDLPGGYGKNASAAKYAELFKTSPAKRVEAHAILIRAAEIFDKTCKTSPALAPLIRKQILEHKWDF